MVLDDLVAERRQVLRRYRPKPKRQKTPYPQLMVAVATGVTLGLYLGLSSNTMPCRLRTRHRSPTFRLARCHADLKLSSRTNSRTVRAANFEGGVP